MKFGNWKIRNNGINMPRLRWFPMVRSLTVFFALISVVVYGLASNSIPASWVPKDKPVLAVVKEPIDKINLLNMFLKITKTDDLTYESIIKSELPLWKKLNDKESSNNPQGLIHNAMYSVTQMDLANPDTYLQGEIPMMALVKRYKLATAEKPPAEIPPKEPVATEPAPEEPKASPALSSEVLVAIYNTHTSETYEPTDGVQRVKGKPGGVYQVSLELKKTLEEKYGIKTVSSDKIHDANNFNYSYGESLITATELVQQNKSLKTLIDLHRDGAYSDKSITTTKINGQDTARIYLIMGTDGNLPYPNWQKNKAFAEKINARMNSLFPGLSRGVKQDIYRYNQHLHDHAILIEVGGVQNTLEEAKRGVDLFAEALAGVINEQNN